MTIKWDKVDDETPITKFEIGQDLAVRSLANYDRVFRFTVVSRTTKFVTLKYFNQLKRVGIKTINGREYCLPLGNYSMSPTLYAGETVKD